MPTQLIIGGISFALKLDEQPLTLGRKPANPLPDGLLKALQRDEYIGREHAEIWYQAQTNQLYVRCLSNNGLKINGESLAAGEKAKVTVAGRVTLDLGNSQLSLLFQTPPAQR
jgi:hypothetical protein